MEGLRLQGALTQPLLSPISLARQVLILYAPGQGYLDELPVEQVSRYEVELWRHAQREFPGVVRRIEELQDLDEELAADMGSLIQGFTDTFT